MQPIDREALRQTLSSALGMYDREANDDAVDTWMSALKAFDLHRVRQAIRDHMEHADDGKRAPRPVDIWRRLSNGGGRGEKCAATSPEAGRCEYPGVFSDGTDGSGQWHCPWHRQHRTGPESDRMIEQSKSVDFASATAERVRRANESAGDSPTVRRIRAAMASRMRIEHEVKREPGEDDEQGEEQAA